MKYSMMALGAALLLSWGAAQDVKLVRVAAGFERPTVVTHAGDGSNRLFVVEQGGVIKLVKNGQLQREPFLDVSSLTRAGGERGLLGLAFDPKFKQSGRFYINYTNTNGHTVIARYTAQGDRANPSSAAVLLTIEQPYANHNGGQLAFGPDGYLYIGTGDGGGGGDPQNHGQNLSSLLGKLLRLDVSGDKYTVPKDNPFVGQNGARGEVWAYGLRNPWRFSFDRENGNLFIADVGQNKFEEINFQPGSSKGGENYGWRLKEANECFNPGSNCTRERKLVDPILQYGRSEGVSVTGGYVYRGKAVPELVGKYVYGDFGSGTVWVGERDGNRWTARRLLDTEYNISTFGQSEAGELYLTDYNSGTLYQFGK
ncbi:PQQ-dependent sugar dehydrogenase [Deinococcus peraridilitoris]|uniref:Glucose/sorbosone dehydrogenase n=1 Tax=Deinococcus peraridilitoris (strain DSM 19664 / LMG 22246 / CIP 109416 / KR-200) TaxID=937777 RepID=K9ZZV3_DEIPD|nr:PQQ-dependent sugar dehydrogenase [Deinococcus peraridilitoris]AFZ66729.1 glucose/sorbosone dehydrogenase [Deinococcus peraridilitoris DSM 19664]